MSRSALKSSLTFTVLMGWLGLLLGGMSVLDEVGRGFGVTLGVDGAAVQAADSPNIVIVFADDLGYADIGPFGAKGYETPNLDRLAKQGIKFTDFHVAQAVCSASRAALLTGCYPNRLGIHGALGPSARHGIHDDEMTLGELVKQRGYATCAIGKWHLGHHPQFLPTRHGFDEYFGLPYSNDMWPHHPEAKPGSYPPLPLIENQTVVNANVSPDDQCQLTTQYTERAVRFIDKHHREPFLLYVAHSMPHVPLFVSDKFRGKSSRGTFGDVISEIDWSVGQITAALERHGIDKNTLVIFTSDNGPWLSYGDHAGSSGPLREGKGTAFEGGTRVPFVARWPGRIPADATCRENAMTIDLFPTIAKLIGADLPKHKIDGRDISPLLTGQPDARSPQDAYFYWYANNELQAVRTGPWKLMFPHTARTLAGRPGGSGGKPAKYEPLKVTESLLFNLDQDLGETTNVADKYPDIVAKLNQLAEQARSDLGDSLTKRTGAGVRAVGQLRAGGQ